MADEQTPYPSNENPSTGGRSYDVSPSSAYGPVRSGSPIPGDSVPDLGMPAGQPQVQPARQTPVTPANYTPVGPQQGYGQQQAGQDAYAYQQAQAQRQAQMRAAQQAQAEALPGARSIILSQGQVQGQLDANMLQLEPQADGTLLCSGVISHPGMEAGTARLTCLLSSNSYQTCVPLSAIHTEASGSFVFVYAPKTSALGVEDSVVRVDVQVLETGEEFAAVQGSLSPKDRIVESANKPLKNGDRVRVEP